ncbi:Tetratricopeptide repeat protein 12 [Terramyces sp. JEL0728]|nr:Tetratricopeptide repeat protein 12 [Terramyces sp. JEL0728]
MDPLESLNEEIGEFEEFVDDFTSKMNDILSGKYKDVDPPKPKSVQVQSDTVQDAIQKSIAPPAERSNVPVSKIQSVANGKLDYAKWSEINEDSPPSSPKLNPSKDKLEVKVSKPASDASPRHKKVVQEAVDQSKKLGKEEFAKHNFEMSLKHFTDAIETAKSPSPDLVPIQSPDDPFKFLDSLIAPTPIPVEPVLYSNRALVYFRLGDYENSLLDCKECLALDPLNVKSMYRKSQCLRSLKDYGDCLDCLKECISLLEHNAELQKQVSLKVCKDQLLEVQLLKKDKEIETEESQALLNDPSSEILGQLLMVYAENPHSKGTDFDKITSNIVVLLKSHTSMKHAFRLLGGFQTLTKFNLKIDLPWTNILVEACTDCNENIREFGENLKRIVMMILANRTKTQSVSKLFSLIGKNEILVNELSRLADFNKQVGELVKDGLLGKHQLEYLNFAAANCKNTFELSGRYKITADWLIGTVLLKSKGIPDTDFLNFIFSLTKLEIMEVKAAISSHADDILCKLAQLTETDGQPTPNISTGLASIHNTLFQSKRKHDKIFNGPKFMNTLCKLLNANQHHDMCLKIFNRLSHYNLNEIRPYLINLDWEKCKRVLNSGIHGQPRELVGDWCQILAVFLKSSSANIQLFRKNGGLPVLAKLFTECIEDQVVYSRVIGNLALSLSVCAQNGKSGLNSRIG